jgi:hypothetical protein
VFDKKKTMAHCAIIFLFDFVAIKKVMATIAVVFFFMFEKKKTMTDASSSMDSLQV